MRPLLKVAVPSLLILLIAVVAVVAFLSTRPGDAPPRGPLVGFERGDFSEVESHEHKMGRLRVTDARAYEGRRSARATYDGPGPGAERVWLPTNWKTGTDVWYGMALFVPRDIRWCYWNPLRWDNYDLYGGVDDTTRGTGDVGGLAIEHDRIRVMRNLYGGHEQTLFDGGTIPLGKWFWLEVHQRFSDRDGQALSELYVDGERRGRSTQANSMGRPIKDLRAGVVNVANQCSSPGSIDFDRLSISDRRRGPV